MPHFDALSREGGGTPLGTSIPPQSPVAWSTFITGLDPDGHGIFDFVHRVPGEFAPFLSTSRKDASGKMELLRRGVPFWEVLTDHDIPAVIFKVPANFPPSSGKGGGCLPFTSFGCRFHAFSGMGTPDILGTYGTFSYFTEGPYEVPQHLENGGKKLEPGEELEVSGGRIVSLELVEGRARLEIKGPEVEGREFKAGFDLLVDRGNQVAEIVVDEQRQILQVGEWSAWMRVDYGRKPNSLKHLTGICLFYLKSVEPYVQFYMSPVNIDPANPVMPVSAPEDAAEDLQREQGLYYTQGMPDETKALEAEVFDYEDFLAQSRLTLDERLRHMRFFLGRFEGGVLFFYVHSLDQLCHMLWRATDPNHPGYLPEFAQFRDVVDEYYVAMDELLGEAWELLGEDGDIIVMSDHGFAPYERSFNLNTWLWGESYLTIDPDIPFDQLQILEPGHVDWKKTRAYGIGLNALYLNLWGREKSGIVEEMDRGALLEEIEQELLQIRDPQNRKAVVKKVYRTDSMSGSYADLAPDLILGFARGYRMSGKSAIGKLTDAVLEDNLSAWSGDHCMAAEEVPGILLSNRPLRDGSMHLRDIPVSILEYYDLEPLPEMAGKSIWKIRD